MKKTYTFYCFMFNCTVTATCNCKREAIACIKRHLGLTERDSLDLIGVNL